jgi:hypothetical protein
MAKCKTYLEVLLMVYPDCEYLVMRHKPTKATRGSERGPGEITGWLAQNGIEVFAENVSEDYHELVFTRLTEKQASLLKTWWL